MALIFDVNQTDAVNNIGSFLYAIKTALTGAGWILKGTGDGTSNSSNVATETNAAALDYFTSPTIAATNRAWFRYRTPNTMSNGTYRELTFQAVRYNSTNLGNANATDWGSGGAIRIKYSLCISGSGFVSGTISANSGTTPNAYTSGDEFIIAGSALGTDTGSVDASGELGGGRLPSIFFNSSTFRWSTCANNSSPYDFYIFSIAKTTKDYASIFAFHEMLSGSYLSVDADPRVFTCYGGYQFGVNFGYNYNRAILGYDTVDQNMVEISRQNPLNIGQGHIASEDNLLPSRFYRDQSAVIPTGWKGLSTFILDPTTFSSRANLDTLSVNTSKDKIILATFEAFPGKAVVVPWSGDVPLV